MVPGRIPLSYLTAQGMSVVAQPTAISQIALSPVGGCGAVVKFSSFAPWIPKGIRKLHHRGPSDPGRGQPLLVGTLNLPQGSWNHWVSEGQRPLGERCSHLPVCGWGQDGAPTVFIPPVRIGTHIRPRHKERKEQRADVSGAVQQRWWQCLRF